MTLFKSALLKQNLGRPPVWFMRQAGRYHSHYQKLRSKHDFLELCKNPELACEVTMGPIEDFDFDAAILFSDLLFPLEAMGMGLTYEPGPKLSWHLETTQDLKKIEGGEHLASHMQFQARAMKLIRARLPESKGLLGFVGGPLTLYYYAAQGSHQNAQTAPSLVDGRFDGFCEKLLDLLAENMALQYRAGADCIAILDTALGEISFTDFKEKVQPVINTLLEKFYKKEPNALVVFYSRGTGSNVWHELKKSKVHGLGVDWNTPIANVLHEFGKDIAIQGNIDPNWLFWESSKLETALKEIFTAVQKLDSVYRKGWICGLGHGVLPGTPEKNVRLFLKLQREFFGN